MGIEPDEDASKMPEKEVAPDKISPKNVSKLTTLTAEQKESVR